MFSEGQVISFSDVIETCNKIIRYISVIDVNFAEVALKQSPKERHQGPGLAQEQHD